MAIVGQNTSSLRKKDLVTQKNTAIAYNALVFQHKATAGDTGINLANLSTPVEASTNGFSQPSTQRLAGAELKRNPHVLKLISSIGGVLQPYVSYVVSGNLQIRFIGFTALEGEIFTGYIDPVAVNGANIIDVSAVPKTGILTAGTTDINIGEQFKVNLHPSQQVGQYALEIDGLGQFRNTSNSSVVQDANYYEVDNGDGTGTIFRLNEARVDDVSYKLTPIGSVLERPAGSAMTVIEQQQGVINKLIEVVSLLSGLEENALTAAPTYPDLKAFGDRVLAMEANRARTDVSNTFLAYQLLAGRVDGMPVPAGYVGERISASLLGITQSSPTVNTFYDDAGTLTLTPGTWLVFCGASVRGETPGSIATNVIPTLNLALRTDSTTVHTGTGASGSVNGVSFYGYISMVIPISISTTTVYKQSLRWRGNTGAPTLGRLDTQAFGGEAFLHAIRIG